MKNKKIEKLIKNLELLSNEIKETIETYTEMTKTGYYKIFKESIFTSINHKIEDRKINPNFFNECEEFIDDLFEFIRNNGKENIISKFTKTINSKTEVDEKSLDKLFFIDEEPYIMEIKDYFGCERKERPEQLEILGEKTIEILEKCKRNVGEILYSVRVLNKKTKSIGIIFDNDNLSAMLHRLEILYALHNIFFEKLKTVRKKTGQYILVGCLGNFVFSEYNFQKREDENVDIYYISE